MTELPWSSRWRPAFERIVAEAPPPARAVAALLEYGATNGLATPPIYVSTAITTAGHRRHADLHHHSRIAEAVARNTRSAALLMGAIATSHPQLVNDAVVMVPTELGEVPGWQDTDYLTFYFAWLAGLNAHGADRLAAELAAPDHQQVLTAANDRSKSNAARWPSYRTFTELALVKLAAVEAIAGTRQGEPSQLLLQLVDVEESLGCRAERLFADARHLHIVAPSVDPSIGGDLGADVHELTTMGARVGVERRQVELVPIRFR